MADFTKNIVNQRFRDVYELLEKSRIIKGKSGLAERLDTYNHVINAILKARRNITVDQIQRLCEHYNVNANYLLGLDDEPFRDGGPMSDLEVQSSETMEFSRNASISLVHERVRAGYALQWQQPGYLESLPKFALPNLQGDGLVAFHISGDSMAPTITQGDLVVCSPVETDAPIYDNNVYVVVTDILVAKRIQMLRNGAEVNAFRLISDNKMFQPYEIPAAEIRQLLKVKCRITGYGIG